MSDEEAVDRVLAGDVDCFEPLYLRYRGMVENCIWRILHDSTAARDLADETMVRAFLNLGKWNRTCRFSSWLWRIGFNAGVDRYRQNLREQRVAVPEEEPFCDPGRERDRRRTALRLARAAEQLPWFLQAELRWHFVEGRTCADIGAWFGRNPKTVASDICRAQLRLRRILLDTPA